MSVIVLLNQSICAHWIFFFHDLHYVITTGIHLLVHFFSTVFDVCLCSGPVLLQRGNRKLMIWMVNYDHIQRWRAYKDSGSDVLLLFSYLLVAGLFLFLIWSALLLFFFLCLKAILLYSCSQEHSSITERMGRDRGKQRERNRERERERARV